MNHHLDGGRGRSADEVRAATGSGPLESVDTAAEQGEGPELDKDELALRRMMRQAVSEIEPSDQALDELQRAVPARRARKRQAAVGAIAVGVFAAMAVPAVLHVTNPDSSGDRPTIAGNSSDATRGGATAGAASGGTGQGDAGTPSHAKGKSKDGKKGKKGGGRKATGGATGGADPASTAAASSPGCEAGELGKPSATVGAPDADGKVYGTFRVANVSGSNCTVDNPGSVVTVAQGAADPTKVSVVDHTSGDGSGLPDPSTEPSQLILEPGKAYEVRFAWVPSASCSASGGGDSGGGSEDPSPSPSASQDTGNGGDATTGTDTQTTTQLGSDGGGGDEGSVAVSHTAEPGAPSTATTIPDACAGTLYRTGILPAS
ncbi:MULTISPECIES: hypothetical protein [unclassified Streptomyces]|uniref:hypothetical protein n=1 Tax=unclassified Streptomyces TaxID=2593676 RepID=UPI00278BFF5B|nr:MULTISPECIES: hypothetical protein [unclassified Streptomyces]